MPLGGLFAIAPADRRSQEPGPLAVACGLGSGRWVVKRQAHGPSFDISILKDTLLIEIDALADALADAIELDT